MASIVIPIPGEQGDVIPQITRNKSKPLFAWFSKKVNLDKRKIIHSVKVGVALVIVSLLYLLDPLYKQVGENAMWAIMTVVVMFEFNAGATLSKGLNRGAGTILGGGLGCIAAGFAHEIGGIGNDVVISISVFLLGAGATYARLLPSIKKRYDYGVMIFILTFNLVVVSGTRADEVIELARKRLSTIGIGFAVCVFISLLIYPIWASDELHCNLASEFSNLACCIEGLFEDYFESRSEKERQHDRNIGGCKMVLYSKSKDESLANFARWEPWHGRFGTSYPWRKYLQIGDILRELAAVTLALRASLGEAKTEVALVNKESIKERCATAGGSVAWSLREMGDSIMSMKRSHPQARLNPKLESARTDLSDAMSRIKIGEQQQGFQIGSLVLLVMYMVDKVQFLTKAVDELNQVAHFTGEEEK
ncbi:hypothetical protein V2J09_016171 [Rumex salicifolius]